MKSNIAAEPQPGSHARLGAANKLVCCVCSITNRVLTIGALFMVSCYGFVIFLLALLYVCDVFAIHCSEVRRFKSAMLRSQGSCSFAKWGKLNRTVSVAFE